MLLVVIAEIQTKIFSLSPFQSVAPIARPAVRVRHRNHENTAFVGVIDQAVRESAQPAATKVLAERMPSVGKLSDPFDRRDRLQQKRVAQAGDLAVVIRNRFVELLL